MILHGVLVLERLKSHKIPHLFRLLSLGVIQREDPASIVFLKGFQLGYIYLRGDGGIIKRHFNRLLILINFYKSYSLFIKIKKFKHE